MPWSAPWSRAPRARASRRSSMRSPPMPCWPSRPGSPIPRREAAAAVSAAGYGRGRGCPEQPGGCRQAAGAGRGACAEPSTDVEEDDLRDIFLEEAREVVQNGLTAIAALTANPGDTSELTTLRRAFHTLKGSSRMVGLTEFGEAAWSLEQVLNTWLADQKTGQRGSAHLVARCHAGFRPLDRGHRRRQADGAWKAAMFRGPAPMPCAPTSRLVAAAAVPDELPATACEAGCRADRRQLPADIRSSRLKPCRARLPCRRSTRPAGPRVPLDRCRPTSRPCRRGTACAGSRRSRPPVRDRRHRLRAASPPCRRCRGCASLPMRARARTGRRAIGSQPTSWSSTWPISPCADAAAVEEPVSVPEPVELR